jgi:hypothetical protein
VILHKPGESTSAVVTLPREVNENYQAGYFSFMVINLPDVGTGLYKKICNKDLAYLHMSYVL